MAATETTIAASMAGAYGDGDGTNHQGQVAVEMIAAGCCCCSASWVGGAGFGCCCWVGGGWCGAHVEERSLDLPSDDHRY